MQARQSWTKPVLTRVKLDPRQAVMQACATTEGYGAWMDGGTACIWGIAPATASPWGCEAGARGSIHNDSFDSSNVSENAGS